ncbi:hypothetical protein Pla52o_41510 [Novipirellula galeiformis]|uniref:Uncharacterized protein n=1 Tax=Novipirellula galeiformis TaxID=2528004 RepID=A0A5C6CB97_9BACT|nr:hypothetical protein [Novipirellula galeiformis]TWU21117.1 hypothetical protein Pla52o_41510 [Novipirellula galeiformis]
MDRFSKPTVMRSLLLLAVLFFSILQASPAHAALQLELDSTLQVVESMAPEPQEPPLVVENADGESDMQAVGAPSSLSLGFGLTGPGMWLARDLDGQWIRWRRDTLRALRFPEPIEVVPRKPS